MSDAASAGLGVTDALEALDAVVEFLRLDDQVTVSIDVENATHAIRAALSPAGTPREPGTEMSLADGPFTVRCAWSDEDGCFIAQLTDAETATRSVRYSPMTHGENMADALAHLAIATYLGLIEDAPLSAVPDAGEVSAEIRRIVASIPIAAHREDCPPIRGACTCGAEAVNRGIEALTAALAATRQADA